MILFGTTEENQSFDSTTEEAIARLRKVTDKDIWIGFSKDSKKDIIDAQQQGADGVVIQSAFVNKVINYFVEYVIDKNPFE